MSEATDQQNINFNKLPVDVLRKITSMVPIKVYQPIIVTVSNNFEYTEGDKSEVILTLSSDGDYLKIENNIIFHKDHFNYIVKEIITSKLRTFLDGEPDIHIHTSIGGICLDTNNQFEGISKLWLDDLVDDLMLLLEIK